MDIVHCTLCSVDTCTELDSTLFPEITVLTKFKLSYFLVTKKPCFLKIVIPLPHMPQLDIA
jgi:hypothetical protein